MDFPVEGVYYIKSVNFGRYANTTGEYFLLSGTEQSHQQVCFEDHSAIFSAHAVSSGGCNILLIQAKITNEPALCPRSTAMELRAT
jgi:hypothetical protein